MFNRIPLPPLTSLPPQLSPLLDILPLPPLLPLPLRSPLLDITWVPLPSELSS